MSTIEIEQAIRALTGDKIHFHPDFTSEFISLIDNSGIEAKIMNEFLRRVAMIEKLNDAYSGLKWLEKLKHYDNMYSLHLSSSGKNLRALFSRTPDGKLFLHTFFEKSGKKDSSYESHVPIAEERRKLYFKEHGYE